ncbi:MAG: pyruvate ferredoxin oxidoreductase, partial [Methylococcales bacterium]|nr:pyruvate ferredoxin oxidoreductase [Methylococcales bacterium]
MAFFKKSPPQPPKYSGLSVTMDGVTAVVQCEREFEDKPRVLADASQIAGLAMSGIRASYTSAVCLTSISESLSVAVNKHVPYIIHIDCAYSQFGHQDYYAINATGAIQLFAKNAQSSADLTLIVRKIAECCLNPVALAQDANVPELLNLPEPELIQEFIGNVTDIIPCPTPAQRLLYGETRRRVPELWNVDQPMSSGGIYSNVGHRATIAAQRPYFSGHIEGIIDKCMIEWAELTGRYYHRVNEYECSAADYLIIAQGNTVKIAEAAADYLLKHKKIKCGVVDITVFRPFPSDLISKVCQGRKGITVMEQGDQVLAEDLPLIADIRRTMSKSIENGHSKATPYPQLATYLKMTDSSPLYSACFGFNEQGLQTEEVIAVVENMLPEGKGKKFFYIGLEFVREVTDSPKH